MELEKVIENNTEEKIDFLNEKIEVIADDPIKIEHKNKNEIEKEEIIIDTGESHFTKNHEYLIYQDDKLRAYLEKKSISKGEIIITPSVDKKIFELNESDFSYIMIFSKIFSQILFTETKAEGTNLIFNYNSNMFKLIARTQDDNLNLNWNIKESTEDFLEQVKNKLILEMSIEIKEKDKTEKTQIKIYVLKCL